MTVDRPPRRPPAVPAAVSRDAARRAAADVLIAVDVDGAFPNLLLPRLLRERRIADADAAFATELTYGATRRSGVLDLVIARAANRDPASLDPEVRAVLRLGAYQLLHLRVPSHAAVSATVDVAREISGPKPTGLVNAVLRKISRSEWKLWLDRIAAGEDRVGRLAMDRGYPRWIADAFLEALGGDLGELDRALVDAPPVTHLVARPGRLSRSALVESAGPGAAPGPWSPYAVHLETGDPGSIASIRDGSAGVQDEGSQLAAIAAATTPIDGPDQWWLDTCAGPGGKSALLASLLPPGGGLLAADLRPHRAALVRGALGRRRDAWVLVADSTRPPWRSGLFDRVLVDAPCSGLGALRRRQEARWRRRPEDVERLHPLQCALLDAALDSARPAGLVAYVTCSPHLRETVQVIDSVRSRRADVEVLDARESFPGVPDLGSGPSVQLWPHRHGTDAMFIALLRRAR